MQYFCTFLWLLAACLILVTSAFGAKRALMQLLVFALICPVLRLHEQTIRLELVIIPALFCIVVVSNSRRLLGTFGNARSAVITFWLAWIVFASLVNGGGHLVTSFSWWMEVYGLARLAMVFWLFAMFAWSSAEIVYLVKLLAMTAVPVCILCIGQVLNWAWARTLTLAAFVPATSPVYQQQLEKEEGGYVFRSLGVFGNVSPNAYYFAMVAGCCAIALLGGQPGAAAPSRKYWLTCGCFSLLGGISTMSGTFVAGLPLVVLMCLWLSRKYFTYRRLFLLAGVIALAFVTTILVVHSNPRLKIQYDYQVEGLISGDRFKSRYDDEVGVTGQAARMIVENPLLGGFGRDESVFIGDSILTLLGFYGGYVGAFIFAAFLALLYQRVGRQGLPTYGSLWLFGALIFGASTTSFFTLRMADWWWALMGIFSAQHLRPKPAVGRMELACPR